MSSPLPAAPAGAFLQPTAGAPIVVAPQAKHAVVRKSGLFAPLLKPIGIALAIVIVGVPAIFAWNIYSASEARRALHDAAVTVGSTVVETPVRRRIADGQVELVLREVDGRLVRVIAPQDAADAFFAETSVTLEEARWRAHAEASAALDRIFAEAFATRDADLSGYADWYFAWGQSWRLLYEATTGAVAEALRLGFSRTQVTDAARHAVEAYLLRHYQEFVLKPGVRDPVIVEGVRRAFVEANDGYRAVLADLDHRMERFVAEHAAATEPLDGRAVDVRIDWDSEKWRAPRHFAEDRYLAPVRTIAFAGAGAVVLGPIVERAALPLLARTSASAVSSVRMAVGGAAVGSIKPGIGTVVGALGGIALDWGLNAFQAALTRDDFIAENAAALDATIAAWKAAILPELDRAIDVWFDDARALVAMQADGAP